ncbi:MAG TPA: hypothetical protein PLI39_04200 [Petrotogaceae bacterium]|nr:hypothetical protein [Petrotogaceae bacterium]HQO12197.1 hypothetical protein [Petrotogaceae bacterium]HQP57798.1 hypothetical protein [Petrotogaceae bacterium]
MNIKRAIISVYNKNGLEKLGRFLSDNGVEIISTGGTAEYLINHGVPVKKISEYTGFPEILEGRVKTLHPKLFGGILAKWEKKNQEEELIKYNIPIIDMVVVNFYPFEEVAQNTSVEKELMENIDIGGVALLRAAAKNYRDVVPIIDPKDYDDIIYSIQDCGDVPLHSRRKLALKAFYETAKYDCAIHHELSELYATEKFENVFFEIMGNLRYGENPLQEATLLKFAQKESILDNIENITKHKIPTLRAVKDLRILYKFALKTDKQILAFAKKGTFVFAYINPDKSDYDLFLKNIDNLRGGVVYTDSPEMIKSLKNHQIDAVLTSADVEKDMLIGYKSMVFKMKKAEIKLTKEYIIDQDLVVIQEYRDISIDDREEIKTAFEVAREHKSDSVVYIKGNKIYSGIQSALNRNYALILLQTIVSDLGNTLEGGTIIFDSAINSENLVNKIKELKIEKVIVPPALPSDAKFLSELAQNHVEVITTQARYHRY